MTTPPNPLPRISPESKGAPPAASKSHTVAWVLGGCGTVLVLAVIAGVLALRMFVKNNVHVGTNGEMDVKMPGGGSMHTGKAKDIGVPIYPGTESSGTGMEFTSPRQEQNMSMATYISSDGIEKVDAWYRENLSKDYVREGPGQKHSFEGNRRLPVQIQTSSIAYVSKDGAAMSVVALNQMGRATQIILMRTGGPTAQ